MKKRVYILILLLVIILGASALILPPYLSKASLTEPLEVVIPNGASVGHIAQMLYDQGAIRSKFWFKYQAKEQQVDRSIKPGTYQLQPNMTFEEIFTLFTKGNPDTPIVLTIPEGWTIYQIAQRVEALGFGTADEFIAATEAYFSEQDYGFDNEGLFYSMEGYLYPDTYHFTEKHGVEDIVKRLAQEMDAQFTEETLNRAKELGLTKHQILTIASLIEREAYNDGERVTISGVIYNRLKKHMPLQIDATVIYALGEGKEHISRVLTAHTEVEHPFNTYTTQGLPPGPIAAPGKASIYAALYPESHDYYYYVMGKDGHTFSKTYEEHKKNVEIYRKMVGNK